MLEQSCKTNDLARGWSAVLLWGLPVIALVVGSYYPEGQACALDSCARCDGRRLSAKRGAMRQSALLCNGAALPDCGSIRCTVGFPFRADATGHFPRHHPCRFCSGVSDRNPNRQIQKESLRRSGP